MKSLIQINKHRETKEKMKDRNQKINKKKNLILNQRDKFLTKINKMKMKLILKWKEREKKNLVKNSMRIELSLFFKGYLRLK